MIIGGEDKSDGRGEEDPALAHASPSNDPPLESPLEDSGGGEILVAMKQLATGIEVIELTGQGRV